MPSSGGPDSSGRPAPAPRKRSGSSLGSQSGGGALTPSSGGGAGPPAGLNNFPRGPAAPTPRPPRTPGTGLHFGHHKGTSPPPGERTSFQRTSSGGLPLTDVLAGGKPPGAVRKGSSTHKGHQPGARRPARGTHRKKGSPRKTKSKTRSPRSSIMAGGDLLTYFPPLASFVPVAVDIFNGPGIPTGTTVGRVHGVNILLTGVWPEGHRQKINSTDSYTHIAILDTSIDLRDPWSGQGGALNTGNQDLLAYPANAPAQSVAEWWKVVFTFTTALPNWGRRKIAFLDRQSAIGTITLQNTTNQNSGAGTSTQLTLAVPAGVQNGDVLLATFCFAGNATITPPAGWTQVGNITSLSTSVTQATYYRIAQGEPTSYTWTLSAAQKWCGAILDYTNGASGNTINAQAIQTNTNGTAVPLPTITTSTNGCRLVAICSAPAQETWTPPGGFTSEVLPVGGAGAALSMLIADASQATAGSSGTLSATISAAQPSIAQILAITPSGAAPL